MADLSADVLIVGGGPGGTAAAIEAARSGLDVLVVDKASFPRDKCCGDGLTTGALRHLDELGLEPSMVPSWRTIGDVYVRTPAGKQRLFPLPTPQRSDAGSGVFAAVARRRDLDSALVSLARSSGAEVFERHALSAIRQSQDKVEASVDGPAGKISIEANYVIAADGVWSPTRKLLGIETDGYRGDWHAFRQYFTNVTGRASQDLLVWFEPDLLPGYAWSFPVDDHTANVGFGILRKPGESVQVMKDLWPEILGRDHVVQALGPDAVAEERHSAWPIPASLGQLPFSKGRVLFVGDALAAADPMTGEGIGQAIETGRLASRCITDDASTNGGRLNGRGSSPEQVTAAYQAELEAGMLRDHRLAKALSSVLASDRGIEASVAIAGATNWTRANFARWLFEDYPRASLITPGRWHRRLMSSPGAFTQR